ncbi:MAG: hypothetical protein CMN25_08710 [Salinicola sp.]|uniref:methionine ABC transporter ATP-binding protein n=1 Tax=uncultured Salinicola sp. TaxID=1193542 RepID=UPI000C9953B9|nr:ATP-binding cassette domain-containing protein [uncultured Salinicola sp.]MAM57400.1 hypothetical protein [Salinicola sp.]
MTVAETFSTNRLDAAAPPTLDAGSSLIRIDNVSKHYCTRHTRVEALAEIDLDIRRGDIFGIIGRSGAGKSTLLRAINRLEPIDQGRVLFDGIDIQRLPPRQLLAARQRIGMIFQHFNLLNSATVADNLALPLKAAGIKNRHEIHRRTARMLDLVGLADKSAVYPAHLSGGQKQRVGIARALMLEPDVLLCDEATSALDPETTASILALIRSINRELGVTVVLITHEMAVIQQVCNRVAVLEGGRLAESGPVWQIFARPQHPATRALLAPLTLALAEDIRERLSPHPIGRDGQALLQWSLDGSEGDPLSLAALADRFGPEAKLIQSRIERLQGHAHGQLLIAIPDGTLPSVTATHPDVEVLGHVAASV